jgi:hypothetical protein
MGDARYELEISNGKNGWQPFKLSRDLRTGVPLFKSELPELLRPAVQVGEATYANFLPNITGVYAQPKLSGGMGKKIQVPSGDAESDRYYYAEGIDAGVDGQIVKGPKVTTVSAPADSGPLSGYFELGGTPYLCLGRKIASYSGGVLTEVEDLGSGAVASGPISFTRYGTEASIESDTSDAATDTLVSSDSRIAQQVVNNETTLRYLSRVDVKLVRVGTLAGDVRLSIMGDLDGKPSNQIITSASFLGAQVDTSAAVYSFRFNDDDQYLITPGEPFWLVLDCTGATAAITMGWRRGSSNTYAAGLSAVSSNRGGSWTTSNSQDYYFDVFARTPVETVFVGDDSTTNKFLTSTDGATFSQDTYRYSSLFAIVGERLVRDIRAVGSRGAIAYSTDGQNWSEAIPVGELTTTITNLIPLGTTLLVCKTDSVWAVDITDTEITVQELAHSFPVASNGVGSNFWKGAAYIPWNGMLMGIQGNFDSGFEITQSCGIESLPEWDSPWGAGRHVAVVGTRYHLYSCVSATDGYRLLKASDPLGARDWHGSLATIGDGTQTVNRMAYYDPGSSSSPHLFISTTDNDVADIVLSRFANPASDANYLYDISNTGYLYFPDEHGNFQVNPKAWLTEAITFRETSPGDSVQAWLNLYDGEGWQTLDEPVYDSAVKKYPRGTSSRVLGRRISLVTTSASSSPAILAVGNSYAVRPLSDAPLRRFEFVIAAENNLSALDLGDLLGISVDSIRDFLTGAAFGSGTRAMKYQGRLIDGVLFLNAADTARALDSVGGAMGDVVVTAVQVA